MSLIDKLVEIPFVHAYRSPKARLMEPTAIRKIPEKKIDLLFINLSLMHFSSKNRVKLEGEKG